MASAKAKTLAQRLAAAAVTRRGLPAWATPAAKAPLGAPPARRATPPVAAFPSKPDEEYDPEELHKALREMRAALDSRDLDAEARAQGDERYYVDFRASGDVDSPGLLLVAAGADTTTRDGTAAGAQDGQRSYFSSPRDVDSPGPLLTAASADTTTRTSSMMPPSVTATSNANGSRHLSYPGPPRLFHRGCTRLMPANHHMNIPRRSYVTWCWTPWDRNRPKPTPKGADEVIRLMKCSQFSPDDLERLRKFFYDNYYSTWEKTFDEVCKIEAMKNPGFAQMNKKMDVVISRMDNLEKAFEDSKASLTKKKPWGTVEIFGRKIDVPKTLFSSLGLGGLVKSQF